MRWPFYREWGCLGNTEDEQLSMNHTELLRHACAPSLLTAILNKAGLQGALMSPWKMLCTVH